MCHVKLGCICRQGFTGSDCMTRTTNADSIVAHSNTGASITWGVLVFLVLIGIIIAVLMYYRRRIRDLKTEIAVEYHANPSGQPDRHHFDNPVYAFQTDNSNLLRYPKPLTTDRYKHGYSDNESNNSRGKRL